MAISEKKSEQPVPTKSLKDIEIDGKILEYIPQDSAIHYQIVPLGVKDGVLEVGALNPNSIEARDALNFISARIGMPYKLYLITDDDFKQALEQYKGLSGEVTQVLSELDSALAAEIQPEEVLKEGEKVQTKIVEDAPVTKIVA